MQIAKQERKAKSAAAVREQLVGRGLDPVEKLMDLVTEEHVVPGGPDEAKKLIAAYLSGGVLDYELLPGSATLRLRASLRAKILLELLAYQHTKPRSSDEPSPANIIVEIKSYPATVKPVSDIVTHRC